jgi:hypothetical protein
VLTVMVVMVVDRNTRQFPKPDLSFIYVTSGHDQTTRRCKIAVRNSSRTIIGIAKTTDQKESGHRHGEEYLDDWRVMIGSLLRPAKLALSAPSDWRNRPLRSSSEEGR